jgi:uncharacterized protein (TIGR03382 family)
VNLSTGVGTGVNRFVAGNGDELLGAFDVQLAPGDSPGALLLTGTTVFTGGTGLFSGATGSARFSGSGSFISDATALTSLRFSGEINLVPEPGSASLAMAGLLLAASWPRRRRLAAKAVHGAGA